MSARRRRRQRRRRRRRGGLATRRWRVGSVRWCLGRRKGRRCLGCRGSLRLSGRRRREGGETDGARDLRRERSARRVLSLCGRERREERIAVEKGALVTCSSALTALRRVSGSRSSTRSSMREATTRARTAAARPMASCGSGGSDAVSMPFGCDSVVIRERHHEDASGATRMPSGSHHEDVDAHLRLGQCAEGERVAAA